MISFTIFTVFLALLIALCAYMGTLHARSSGLWIIAGYDYAVTINPSVFEYSHHVRVLFYYLFFDFEIEGMEAG